MAKEYSSAMIVIGDEILSGRTRDDNINYTANKLVEIGVTLSEVRVVPDDEGAILKAIHELKDDFDYVFTTGGIGPTHDDITALSVAKAFGVELELRQDIYDLLKSEYKGGDFTEASARMAMLPVGAALIPNLLSAAPGFIIENVYVMAGVPVIMHKMMDYVVGIIEGGSVMGSRNVTCSFGESRIAKELGDIQNDFPNVSIGSYPNFSDGQRGVGIVLRSINEGDLAKAEQAVSDMVRAKTNS